MKIVLVHNTYREAGGEDVVFENEKRLLERSGHAVVPYLRSNWEIKETSAFHRISIAPRMLWSSSARRDFARILDAERPDIVHVHNTFMVVTPSIYSACSDRSIPVVQTLHNFRLLCPSASFFRRGEICKECVEVGLLRSIRHRCYRDSAAASAAVAAMLGLHRVLNTYRKSIARYITLTKFARDHFISAGFPSDRFTIKPNFVDPDPGERTGAGECALFVGRLMENKGTRVLLDAWKKLSCPLPLQIIGDGPDRQALEAEARDSNLSSVAFRGQVPRESVIEAIKKARFVIVPSTLYEGFPLAIVESFACGTPVLCSRLGSLEEVVQNGETGLHFRPGDGSDLADKATWAWNHPADLAAMGRNARRKYEAEYTAERNYAQLMETYRQALASGPAVPAARLEGHAAYQSPASN